MLLYCRQQPKQPMKLWIQCLYKWRNSSQADSVSSTLHEFLLGDSCWSFGIEKTRASFRFYVKNLYNSAACYTPFGENNRKAVWQTHIFIHDVWTLCKMLLATLHSTRIKTEKIRRSRFDKSHIFHPLQEFSIMKKSALIICHINSCFFNTLKFHHGPSFCFISCKISTSSPWTFLLGQL